ncbi:glycosyltransferase [Aquimarina sp. RZ0]|nr:glycosyltransferase [Aquimarina sp. RZ0]
MIFTRNPELGKCKTRLAATIGKQSALDVYTILLDHTVSITKDLQLTKEVYYSTGIKKHDIWDPTIFHKKLQIGEDLGIRMFSAFDNGFKAGYQNIIIIGSDMYELSQKDIEIAFDTLKTSEYVIGPAEDGGFYLLGMKSVNSKIFQNKSWGTDTVLADILQDLKKQQVVLLEEKNDIDYYEDILPYEIFRPFIKTKNLTL